MGSKVGRPRQAVRHQSPPRPASVFGDEPSDLASFDLSSLTSGWCVGSKSLLDRVRREFGMDRLIQIYGSTEGGGTAGDSDQIWEVRSTTCGRAVEGTELRITDVDTGLECEPGKVGEVRLRGWWMMNGYLNQPEATARAIDPDGWLHTGDLGSVHENGNLVFAGRLKDMLKVGGENVSAEEVENVLLSHADIVQAAAIGYPDELLGEVVFAIVEARKGSGLNQDDVVRYCAGIVAGFRVPRRVEFVKEWPMTDSGKIKKNVLREYFAAASRSEAVPENNVENGRERH